MAYHYCSPFSESISNPSHLPEESISNPSHLPEESISNPSHLCEEKNEATHGQPYTQISNSIPPPCRLSRMPCHFTIIIPTLELIRFNTKASLTWYSNPSLKSYTVYPRVFIPYSLGYKESLVGRQRPSCLGVRL